jgi:hypothetical protein
MRVIDYIAIALSIVFVIGCVGAFSRFGEMVFWFWAGLTVISGSVLFYMSSQ